MHGLFNNLKMKILLIEVAGNHNYMETDIGINFVQSSLKSHTLWVSLHKYKFRTVVSKISFFVDIPA